jgi:hypothetical protein
MLDEWRHEQLTLWEQREDGWLALAQYERISRRLQAERQIEERQVAAPRPSDDDNSQICSFYPPPGFTIEPCFPLRLHVTTNCSGRTAIAERPKPGLPYCPGR